MDNAIIYSFVHCSYVLNNKGYDGLIDIMWALI